MKLEAADPPIQLAPSEARAGVPEVPAASSIPGLISVIVPTFNRLALLGELLASLEEQTWVRLQVIIVDDGSTDGTFAALADRGWRSGIEVECLRQENRGPAAARNRGLAIARGEFVYFIDSDDLVLPIGLATLAQALRETGAPYCLARVRNVDRWGDALSQLAATLPRIDRSGIVGSGWPIHVALYRREVLVRAGRFNEALTQGEDTEMIWRVLSTSGVGVQIDDYVALRRFHDEGRISDDTTAANLGSTVYRMLFCFVSWAEANRLLRPPVATRAAQVLSIARIRLRAADCEELSQAAAELGRRLEECGARRPLLARLVETALSRRVFEAVLPALHWIRDVRNNILVLLGLLRGAFRRR